MNRSLILAFILLATLFMVNAAPYSPFKRTEKVTFERCEEQKNSELITVKISPDPPVSNKPEKFIVSGVLKNNDITADGTVLEIRFTLNDIPLINNYNQKFTESFSAGDPFKITASKVPTPDRLPDSYEIEVIVGDPIPIPEEPIKIFGCAYAVMSGT